MSVDTALEARRLYRRFGKVTAVRDLSFGVGRGQVFGFIGPNGSGKTTTMRILAGLDIPDSGDAIIDGLSVLEQPRNAQRRVGYMSDRFTPYANLNVGQYLDFFARVVGLRGDDRVEAVAVLAGFCGLETFLDRPAGGLSKGMGQRLHLAKTLLHDPAVLVLDEPTAGLDPRARIDFRELTRELARRGKTILVSSHILSELSEICDGVVILERGARVAAGTLEEVSRGVAESPGRAVRVRPAERRDELRLALAAEPGVADLVDDGAALAFRFSGDDAALAALLARVVARGLPVLEFHLIHAGLEDVFLRATQGRLQ